MGMNYFVMNTLSTVRAFIAGEGLYSKGQKDTTYFLVRYTATHRKEEYLLFLENIRVPLGDHLARIELQKENSDYSIIDAALIQAKNEPSETRDIARFFKRFKNVSYFKQSIHYWTLGDQEIQKIILLAEEIHNLIINRRLTQELANKYLLKIDKFNKRATFLEVQYARVLYSGVRWITSLLFYISFTLTILGFLIAVWVTLKITQDILKLIEILKLGTIRVEQGILTSPIEITSPLDTKDELIQLAISFNKMTISLNNTISERDLALEKLEVRANQLSEAQELAHIGSWEYDLSTELLTATDQFYRICGLELGSTLTAEILLQFVHPSDVEFVLRQLEKTLVHHELYYLDHKIITPSGEIREVSQKGRPILNDEGELIKIIGTSQDITERLNIQLQMIQSNKMATLGEMASGIAHEINNPLAIIKMTALQMQKIINPENTVLKSNVARIDSTVDRISKIIQGLRTFSRDGRNDPFELVSFNQMLEDILSFSNERLKHHSIKFIIDDYNAKLVFEGRAIEISQVLLNLFNNSIDALNSLEMEDKWIKISAKNEGIHLEIKISDSGRGIPRDIQNKIFQPFFTTKEIGQGTGLGLSLSLTIIKNHQGEIFIDEQSPNTCFILRLPIKQNRI